MAQQKTHALIEWLREYARQSINSLLIDERRCIPPHIVLEFGNQGLFGLQIPQHYSGLGLSYQETTRVMQQLGAIDLTLATLVSTHANGVYPLQHYGNNTLKDKFLPAFAQGREISAFGLTELGAGSNPYAISTTATPIDAQHWRITGKKIWVDSGAWASLMITFVYLSEFKSTQKLISAFAVPLATPNIVIEEEALTMGLRGMVQNHISFNNAMISQDYLLGAPGEGMEIAQQALTKARLMLAAKCIGAMKYCLQLMQRYAKQRTVATGVLLDNPVIIAWMFEISSGITAIENLVQWLAERLDHGQQDPLEIFFIVKNFAAEWLWKAADLAMQTLGGRGYMECNAVSRILRDARTMRISEGPTEPLTMALGANVINSGKIFYDFIARQLNNHQIAENLVKTTAKIKQRCIEKWGYFLAGEVTSHSILLAALEYQIAHKPTEALHLAHSWLNSQLTDLTQRVSQTTPIENVFSKSNQLNRLIETFVDDIGEPEQRAPFANYQTDPMLNLQVVTPPKFLSAEENHFLLNVLNDTTAAYPQDQCLHELFEQQVKRHGKKTAVILQDKSLTYQQLDDHANQIAYVLQQKGVAPGMQVGLFFDHSLELIVSLFAVLKTGAAYVPLDIHYPEHRVQFVLQDAQLTTILTRSDLTEKLPSCSAEIVKIDLKTKKISQAHTIRRVAKPTDTAYILYTSGSTGLPKGVRISHSALVNFMVAMQKQPGITQQDIVLAHTTIAFDIVGLEIYLPLVSGASMVLCPRRITLDSQAFIQYIQQHQVNVIQATPALWRMLISAGWSGHAKLKILSGGEALPTDLAQQLVTRAASVWNMYGPTEATIWCSVYQVNDPSAFSSTPIGKPIANTQFYILDADKRLTPLGTPGELYISGNGLAQGYWNRPDLNEERFIEHTLGSQKIRLYRTGDSVKYLADGTVLFLGRVDRQIKLRGFRIEPGEIEHVLRQFSGINEAVVTTKQFNADDTRLVAYLMSQTDIDEVACRQFLERQLPAYMIPNVFVQLRKLPLTANGKIDHHALPEPNWGDIYTEIPLPDHPLQRDIMEIWLAVLGTQKLTVDSNFFALGGHSLLAAQIVGKIVEKFSVELSLHDFFNHPTILKLSKFIENSQQDHQLMITPQKKTPLKVPITLQQKYMIFRVGHLPLSTHAMNNCLLVFDIQGQLETKKLKSALKKLCEYQKILTSALEFKKNTTYFGYHPTIKLPFKEHNLTTLTAKRKREKIHQILMAEKLKVFDLDKAPLWRCGLIQLSAESYIFYFNIHHVIFDGLSSTVFYNELVRLYNEPEAEKPHSIQYFDYAIWQQQWLKAGNLDKLLDYWEGYLTGIPKRLILKNSLPTTKPVNFELGEYEFSISNPVFQALEHFCAQEKITVFNLLATALTLSLYQHSQQEEIVLGYSDGHRQYKGVEKLIGLFTAHLVLRFKMDPQSSFRDFSAQVKEHIINHFRYSYLPWEALLERLHSKREGDYHPVFQVFLTLADESTHEPFSKTQVKSFHYKNTFAKMDMILFYTSSGNNLKFRFDYKSALYSEKTIASLAEDFKRLLSEAVQNPELLIQQLCPIQSELHHQNLCSA